MPVIGSAFLATGGIRHPSAADWDHEGSGLLAFGTSNNIALWDPLDGDFRGIKALLSGHSDTVNAVKFFPTGDSQNTIIISGSTDKTIRVWTSTTDAPTGFRVVKVIAEHQNPINCLAVLPGSDIFASGSSDGTVKVWKLTNPSGEDSISTELLQTISLTPKFFPMALAIHRLDESSLILAAAGTRADIHIYVSDGESFKPAARLTGHEAWIRSLTFSKETSGENSDLILASASQDRYIRLWRVHQGEELPAASAAANDPALRVLQRSLSNKAHRFETKDSKYSITFEALLLGHEDWIYTASWRRTGDKLQLLSTSADNSLSIWEADPVSGVWICVTRLGEISAQKGATTATGSTGGFWIGLWSPKGDAVVSLGRTGSWRMWKYVAAEDRWVQEIAITGHIREVRDISWATDGSYLLSTSSDQTTRLWAEWRREGKISWHEFSRPQIHGYDLNCIGSIKPSRFISGADEKLLRVFDEPAGVANLLQKLGGVEPVTENLPDAANIPVLGLSNKAIQAVDDDVVPGVEAEDEREAVDPASIVHKSTLTFDHPPFEDHLARHLLWPETEKLYGHGYEISALATSHDGTLVATACRATSLDHAVIRLFELATWRELKPPLTAHTLTVTGLDFSADDRYLLSVSRDRQWAVFVRDPDARTTYKPAAINPKGHSRMILDGSWAPDTETRVFATAGRDKSVKLWQLEGSDAQCKATIAAAVPVTAVSFLPHILKEHHVLAYGTEDGAVTVCTVRKGLWEVDSTTHIDRALCPSKTVNALQWRPKQTDGGRFQLAVASDDSSIRLYDIGDIISE